MSSVTDWCPQSDLCSLELEEHPCLLELCVIFLGECAQLYPLWDQTQKSDSLALSPYSESLTMVRALTSKGSWLWAAFGARRDSQFAVYRLTLPYKKELPTKIKYCQGWRGIEGQDVTEPPTCWLTCHVALTGHLPSLWPCCLCQEMERKDSHCLP